MSVVVTPSSWNVHAPRAYRRIQGFRKALAAICERREWPEGRSVPVWRAGAHRLRGVWGWRGDPYSPNLV